jgi:hypothetical protein
MLILKIYESCRAYSQFTSNFNLHDIDPLEAVTEIKIVIRRLADERNDVHVWEALFDKACEVASEFEMEASKPRVVSLAYHLQEPT